MRRPVLYIVAAALGIAMAIPMAASSGQIRTGGIFDECYDAACDGYALTANAED